MNLKLVTYNSDNGLLLSVFPAKTRKKQIVEAFKAKLIKIYRSVGHDKEDAETEFYGLEKGIEITTIKQGTVIRNEDAHY